MMSFAYINTIVNDNDFNMPSLFVALDGIRLLKYDETIRFIQVDTFVNRLNIDRSYCNESYD